MVQSLQVVILLLSVTLLAVIVVFLARRNRFWKMVRRSMRAKIDLIYDMRAQYAELSDHARESIPRMTRIGDTLEALAARKDLPPECRVQVDRALLEMKELDRTLPRIRATLQIPEEELATETRDSAAQEDREFTDRLYAIFSERMADEKFNVGVLATQMGMSRSQLFKRVREVTGESPKQLLNKIRLQSAERMLEEGNMTVSEVADATGWNSVSYFSKSFKRRFGRNPKKNKE
jgi:AraC-like DNA-binding protein